MLGLHERRLRTTVRTEIPALRDLQSCDFLCQLWQAAPRHMCDASTALQPFPHSRRCAGASRNLDARTVQRTAVVRGHFDFADRLPGGGVDKHDWRADVGVNPTVAPLHQGNDHG